MQSLAIRTALALGLIMALYADNTAQATITVGTLSHVGTDDDNPQDALSDVVAVIDAYNAAKDPDLTTDITLFKKSDDVDEFVFDAANGFEFFSDAAGLSSILTMGDLHSLTTAYFRYSGPETLEYYNVKAARGFSLYQFDSSGLNILTRDDNDQNNVSHVSFWKSTVGRPPAAPEPSTFVLTVLGLVSLSTRRRRIRRA